MTDQEKLLERLTDKDADLTGYRDSMRPLILKDIVSTLQKIAEQKKKI